MPRLNPKTTPRHQLRAEKARKNQEAALAAFLSKKAEIDEMLARLQALSDDHFGFHPDAINWASVGSVSSVASDLKEITDFLFGEGEHAEQSAPPQDALPAGRRAWGRREPRWSRSRTETTSCPNCPTPNA